jgi:DNA-binding response OmpR family regulator
MNHTVLLIGSDINMLNSLEFLLEAENFKVCKARYDMGVIEEFNCNGDKIDLIIADTLSSVKRCSGFIETVKLKNGEVPFVILTSHFEKSKPLNFGNGEKVVYVEKPFNVFSLIEKIRDIINTNFKEAGSC